MMIKRLILVAAFLGVIATVQAQNSLADLVQEADVGWMQGDWEGTTDDGQTLRLSHKWDLNKQVVSFHLKLANDESRGMTFVDPETYQVKYFGVDSHGMVSTGTWSAENGQAMLKVRWAGKDGNSGKAGALHKKVDQDTMKMEVYELDSVGELVHPPHATMTFNRKKNQ